jgi:glycosyltransferase involved in cell wall biosynthesis
MPPVPRANAILHVCAGNQFGGVESMLVTIARTSSEAPRLPHVFACCFEGRFSQALRSSGSPPFLLPGVRLSRPWEIFRARSALRRLVSTLAPSIIVTHSAWTRLVFGRSLVHPSRRSTLPTVAWIHGAGSPLSRLDRWGQRPRPDLVLLNSRHTGALTESLFPHSPRQVLYCPVPPPPPSSPTARQTLRQSLGATPDQTVLLIAARLEPWKGHELLFDGLAALPTSTSWVCWIAGGPQTAEQAGFLQALQQRAQRLGIANRVVFLGERQDVAQLMSAADVYCQPNLGPEPFGVVFVEALYAGLPVVTTALGGALEILNDDCGRLVPPGNAAVLTQTLNEVLANPELRARLGANGPARARELCDPTARLIELEQHLLGP